MMLFTLRNIDKINIDKIIINLTDIINLLISHRHYSQ